MSKNWTKREINFYGGRDSSSVCITVTVYGHDHLTNDELKRVGDNLADKAMQSINAAPYIVAPLSRIDVKRNAK